MAVTGGDVQRRGTSWPGRAHEPRVSAENILEFGRVALVGCLEQPPYAGVPHVRGGGAGVGGHHGGAGTGAGPGPDGSGVSG